MQKKKVGTEEKKRVNTILNKLRNNLVDYDLDPNTIVRFHKNINMTK